MRTSVDVEITACLPLPRSFNRWRRGRGAQSVVASPCSHPASQRRYTLLTSCFPLFDCAFAFLRSSYQIYHHVSFLGDSGAQCCGCGLALTPSFSGTFRRTMLTLSAGRTRVCVHTTSFTLSAAERTTTRSAKRNRSEHAPKSIGRDAWAYAARAGALTSPLSKRRQPVLTRC